MKRFLISAVAAATVMAAAVPVAQAAQVAADFTVSVAFTSKCQIQSGNNGTLAFAYVPFDPDTAQTGAGVTVTFECTRGLAAPTVVFDDDGATDTKVGGTAAAASVTGSGLVAGLRYQVVATRGTTGAGTAATASSGGTAATVPYLITGKIFGGQAGTQAGGVAAAVTGTQARTLTLVY